MRADTLSMAQRRFGANERKVPYWAKAEQMEICIPEEELWKYPNEHLSILVKK